MARHLISAALLWLALTAIGEALAFSDLFPTVGSESAEEFDHIFRVLLIMGVPVFAFVIAVLTYSFLQFRSRGPDETGATFHGRGAVPRLWLGITGGLAVLTIIYPGMTGLADLQKDDSGYGWGDTRADILVRVTGQRYAWEFEYVNEGVKLPPVRTSELVLPVHKSVKFEITSIDVVHSFWIPAFRMKIDAIPGRTTFLTITPEHTGNYAADDAYRAQCAELCGLDHSVMYTPVRVVEQAEFDAWVAEQKAGGN